jgi:hypothetical protein
VIFSENSGFLTISLHISLHYSGLLNVRFKIFTKVIVNRLTGIATRLINPSYTTFILGRNVMEGVVMLHETIHELHRKKISGVIFKLDFEKTYDKVNWDCLQQTLSLKEFSENGVIG